MIPKVSPFETYKQYLSLKQHFTKEKYDYHRYGGKSRASLQSFYKRKDRFFFEKLSRQKDDQQVIDFFVSNFVGCDDPQTLWIGKIVKDGDECYNQWRRRVQSLSYFFKGEMETLLSGKKFDSIFSTEKGHPLIVKEYLSNNLSLESLVILDKILNYRKDLDKRLSDPVWEFLSMRIKKYETFLNIDMFHYKKLLKEMVLNGT